MKIKILSAIMAIGAMVGFTACDDWDPNSGSENNRTGQVSMASMQLDVEALDPIVIESRAGENVDNFIIDVYNSSNALQQSWKYSDMPEVMTLPVGTYTLKARSHNVAKGAWEEPYYVGEAAFEVFENKITDIGTVTCKFASIKVTIEYAGDLYQMLGDDVKVQVVCNDDGSLTYGRDEKRAGYFEALEGSSTLAATISGTINGVFTTYYRVFTDVKAAQHRKIVFSARKPSEVIPDEFGEIVIDQNGLVIDMELVNVDINGNVVDEDQILDSSNRPGQEEPEEGDDPTPDPGEGDDPTPGDEPVATFECPVVNGLQLTFDAPNQVYENMDHAVVNIHCEKTINNFVVAIYTNSDDFRGAVSSMLAPTIDTAPYDSDKEFATCFDLTTIDPSLDVYYVESLGFKVRDDVKGQSDLTFDIKGLAPLLGAFSGTHRFSLIITDAEGRSITKTLTFVVTE